MPDDGALEGTELEQCECCGEQKNCIEWEHAKTLFTLWRFEVKFIESSATFCKDCMVSINGS